MIKFNAVGECGDRNAHRGGNLTLIKSVEEGFLQETAPELHLEERKGFLGDKR